jgi:WD40 repeat protein
MAEPTPGRGVSAVFTPDGREVLYWGGEGRVQCRSVATGRSRALPVLGNVLEMAFRPDGKQVTVLSEVPSDGRPRDWKPRFTVALFDWPSGRQVLQRDVEPRSGTEQVVLALDGGALLRMLPPGYTDKDPRWTFAVESLRDKTIFWGLSRVPASTVWGRLEGAGGLLFQSEGALHFHDLRTGTVQLSIPQKQPIPFHPNASCFRSGDFLFLHFGGHLLRISLEKKQVTHRIQLPTTKLLLRAGGKELLYHANGIIKRLDAATLRPLPSLAYRGWSGMTLSAISPDGKTLLLAEWKRCRLVDADTGRTLHDREGHDSPLDAMAFSPDARRIATAAGRDILVWDRAGRCLASWRHPQGIASLSFDATGDRVAVGGFRYWEGTSIAQVRDLRRNRTIFSIEAHLGAVGSVAFTPDGERLVTSGTEDARLRWWNIAKGERLGQVKYIERPTILDVEENRVLASDGRGGIAWYRPNGARSFLVGEGSIRSDSKVRRLRSRIVAERSDGVA